MRGSSAADDKGVEKHEWDDKDAADKTWDNMQTHFKTWYDKKMKSATASSTGFHGANLATSTSQQEILQRETTEALKCNQAMIANLAKKNDDKDNIIAKLRAENASLKTEVRLLRERRGTGGSTGRQQQSGAGHFQGQGPNLSNNEKNALRLILPQGHYCHTCGYGCDHSSRDCPTPGPNHVGNATKFNPQGGSTHRN